MRYVLLLAAALLFGGCSQLLPYKTEFDCKKAPGGHCGSLTGNIKEAYDLAGITGHDTVEPKSINYDIKQVTLEINETVIVKKYYKKKRKKRRRKKVCKYVYY